MVPIPDSVWLPPIDKCMNGDAVILSWEEAFKALSNRDDYQDEASLTAYFREPNVFGMLRQPFEAFTATTQQTKASFQSRTAAINVTPNPSGQYNIEQIKEDTLWLSQEIGIDEVSALRVVVQECQSRSAGQLSAVFSKEEASSLREASGNLNTDSSLLVQRSISVANDSEAHSQYGSTENRRVRALQIYLAERNYALQCSCFLLSIAFNSLQSADSDKGKNSAAEDPIIELARDLLESVGISNGSCDKFLLACTKALRQFIQNIDKGSGWLKDSGHTELIEADFSCSQIVQTIHLMELIFLILDSSPDIPSTELILDWFGFLSQYGFFDLFEPPEPIMQVLIPSLRSMASTVSLSMIRLSACLEIIGDTQSTAAPSADPPDSPYVLDMNAIAQIQAIFLGATETSSVTAGPALFAWVVLLQSVRSISIAQIESREIRQSQFAAEGFGAPSIGTSSSENNAGRPDRRFSAGVEPSPEADVFEKIMETIMDSSTEEDPINYLARSVVEDFQVFDQLVVLISHFTAECDYSLDLSVAVKVQILVLELIRCGVRFVGYVPDAIEALLQTMTGGHQYWDLFQNRHSSSQLIPINVFFTDDFLVESFLVPAISRYPYETIPFLKMVRAIASSNCMTGDVSSAVDILSALSEFTFILPEDFRDYETIQEEDDMNTIRLLRTIPLFEPRKTSALYNSPQSQLQQSLILAPSSDDLCIPAGSHGRIVADTGPKVVVWFCRLSGLRYLGKLLETALVAGDSIDATTGDIIGRDSIVEIIKLLAVMLLNCTNIANSGRDSSSAQVLAESLLGEASDCLDRNRDIVSVIFDIFEQELEEQIGASMTNNNLDILNASLQFIHSLIPIFPGRVWPLLGRSSLLAIDGKGGRLSAIVTSIEMISGHYEFLLSSVYLLEALVEDSKKRAALRKGGSKSLARLGKTSESLGTGVPDQVLSKVIASFIRTMADIFDNSCNWKFVDQSQRLILCDRIATVFNDVLTYNYGIDDRTDQSAKLSNIVLSAANFLADRFARISNGSLKFQPVLRALIDGYFTPSLAMTPKLQHAWASYVTSVLKLTTTSLRIGSLRGQRCFQLEEKLLKSMPLIVRLYVADESYKLRVIEMLDALVSSASASDGEPPSVLGHLSSQTSKIFIEVLSQLDKPLANDDLFIAIWRLFSAVVCSRQQWFALCLLTGRTPRDAVKREDAKQNSGSKSLLQRAVDGVRLIERSPLRRTLALLDFISLGLNSWPWAMTDVQKDSAFIDAMSNFVGKMEPTLASASIERSIENCYRVRIAAYVADILAMVMFQSKQLGGTHLDPDSLLKNLSYYTRFAVAVPLYNTSLHGNLKRNFEDIYDGCSLQNFKNSGLVVTTFGRGYFYNLDLAAKMLDYDRSWLGRRNDGLAHELAMANVNLSLVDAQVALQHSWKIFAIELCGNLSHKNVPSKSLGVSEDATPQDKTVLAKTLAKVAGDCLISNTRSQLPEQIFERLTQTRADLALVLIQRLVESNWAIAEVRNLLEITWTAIKTCGKSYEMALAAEEVAYYRTLLKILFLTLSVHTANVDQSSTPLNSSKSKRDGELRQISGEFVRTVLTIIDLIVARGFRDLVASIHEDSTQTGPEDFALITAILQACLRFPEIASCQNQILASLAAYDTARVAATLFSWAESLAVDGDPIYGELSILFLLELSSVSALAEQLAVEGTLGHISTANITSYLRGRNVSPFAEGAGLQRCYSIWVRGLLPLILNLLHAVGASIATEVAIFLSQFPTLLKNSSEALDAPRSNRMTATDPQTRHIAYPIVQEVHSLALITLILSSFRISLAGVTDIPDVEWDGAAVMEDVDYWLTSRHVLREKILPLSPREMELSKQKPKSALLGCKSRLEEKVVEELTGLSDVLTGEE